MSQQWNDKGEWLEAIELEDVPADVIKSISARLRELSSALPPPIYVVSPAFSTHPNPVIAKWLEEATKRTKRDFDGEWLSSDMTQEESSLEINTPGHVTLLDEYGELLAQVGHTVHPYPDAFPHYPNCRTCERPLQELVDQGVMLVIYIGRSYCSDKCATEAMISEAERLID